MAVINDQNPYQSRRNSPFKKEQKIDLGPSDGQKSLLSQMFNEQFDGN